MKKVITSVEELYASKNGTGEVVLDTMADCLRRTRIISAGDLAALMDADPHQLNAATRLLTGMTVRDIICRWRLLQARDLLKEMAGKTDADSFRRLDIAARRCGWRSYRVMLKVARRYGGRFDRL